MEKPLQEESENSEKGAHVILHPYFGPHLGRAAARPTTAATNWSEDHQRSDHRQQSPLRSSTIQTATRNGGAEPIRKKD